MYQDIEFKELCSAVREEFPDLTQAQIAEIVRDCFDFLKEHIRKGSLEPVYFQYLGTFQVSAKTKKKMENKKKWNELNIKREFSPKRNTDTPSKE